MLSIIILVCIHDIMFYCYYHRLNCLMCFLACCFVRNVRSSKKKSSGPKDIALKLTCITENTCTAIIVTKHFEMAITRMKNDLAETPSNIPHALGIRNIQKCKSEEIIYLFIFVIRELNLKWEKGLEKERWGRLPIRQWRTRTSSRRFAAWFMKSLVF